MSQERRDQEEMMTEASTPEARPALHLAYLGLAVRVTAGVSEV